MNGLNPEPCASYSLQDRFVCGKCGVAPEIVRADGPDPLIMTFSCHGEKLSKSFSKSELVFTQVLWSEEN